MKPIRTDSKEYMSYIRWLKKNKNLSKKDIHKIIDRFFDFCFTGTPDYSRLSNENKDALHYLIYNTKMRRKQNRG